MQLAQNVQQEKLESTKCKEVDYRRSEEYIIRKSIVDVYAYTYYRTLNNQTKLCTIDLRFIFNKKLYNIEVLLYHHEKTDHKIQQKLGRQRLHKAK